MNTKVKKGYTLQLSQKSITIYMYFWFLCTKPNIFFYFESLLVVTTKYSGQRL